VVWQAHKDRNLARKLTPAERREKKHVKLVGASGEGEATTVAVYSIDRLSNPAHRFKVRVNAEVRALLPLTHTRDPHVLYGCEM